MLGSMAKALLPASRAAVVARDDDKQNSPADQRIRKVVREWQQAKHGVAVAFPWPERRHDGSDINDTLQAEGAAAVRERIEGILVPKPPPPRNRRPVKEAQAVLAKAVGSFFDRAALHDPVRLGLTRFGGHPETFTGGVADAGVPTAVFA